MDHAHRILIIVLLAVISWQLFNISGATKNIGQAYACPAYGYEVSY